MRKIEIELHELLDVISCAETYGYKDSVLFDFFWESIGKTLTDEEIEEYAQKFLTESAKEEGYTEEDYTDVKEVLIEFREEMQNNG